MRLLLISCLLFVASMAQTVCPEKFATAESMLCDGMCGQVWGDGVRGCQDEDADSFCRLKYCDQNAYAISYDIVNGTGGPGFACSNYFGAILIQVEDDLSPYWGDFITNVQCSHKGENCTCRSIPNYYLVNQTQYAHKALPTAARIAGYDVEVWKSYGSYCHDWDNEPWSQWNYNCTGCDTSAYCGRRWCFVHPSCENSTMSTDWPDLAWNYHSCDEKDCFHSLQEGCYPEYNCPAEKLCDSIGGQWNPNATFSVAGFTFVGTCGDAYTFYNGRTDVKALIEDTDCCLKRCENIHSKCECVGHCGWEHKTGRCYDASYATTSCSECHIASPYCIQGTCTEWGISSCAEYNSNRTCHCNSLCVSYGNCCGDAEDMCKQIWTPKIDEDHIECAPVFIYSIGSAVLYWSLLAFVAYCRHQNCCPTTPKPIHGGIFLILFDGSICGYHKFIPSHKKLEMIPERKSYDAVLTWAHELGGFSAASIGFQIFDVITDLAFANEIFKESACAGSLAAASALLASLGTCFMWERDFKNWMFGIDKNDRYLHRLRWNVLIISPVEDCLMISLGIYVYLINIAVFWTFMSLAMSVAMFCSRFYFIKMAALDGVGSNNMPIPRNKFISSFFAFTDRHGLGNWRPSKRLPIPREILEHNQKCRGLDRSDTEMTRFDSINLGRPSQSLYIQDSNEGFMSSTLELSGGAQIDYDRYLSPSDDPRETVVNENLPRITVTDISLKEVDLVGSKKALEI